MNVQIMRFGSLGYELDDCFLINNEFGDVRYCILDAHSTIGGSTWEAASAVKNVRSH